MKTTFDGLFLWKVGLRGSSTNLWIVTRKNSVTDCGKKAKKFLKTSAGKSITRDGQIESVTYEGTIDA